MPTRTRLLLKPELTVERATRSIGKQNVSDSSGCKMSSSSVHREDGRRRQRGRRAGRMRMASLSMEKGRERERRRERKREG
jgi:hypothetical protein